MKVLFVEPPRDSWFVMGEYLPPPLGILQLAAFLETRDKNVDIEVLDCQAERLDWKGLERRLESLRPDMVAPSSVATCNTFTVVRALEMAKEVDPEIVTVVGGQHFTATAEESLEQYPEIDFVVRGEGEETFTELVQRIGQEKSVSRIKGISFKHEGKVMHNPKRSLIDDLDKLPFPGYHFVEKYMKEYHFTLMAGAKKGYALVEASRGCSHRCTFCSQWKHWEGVWRTKSAKRIVDEMEHCYSDYGISFLWLTDDNLCPGKRASDICDEIIDRGIEDDIMWFAQARSDDIVKNSDVLPKMRKAGTSWILVGIENHDPATLEAFRKEANPSEAKTAMDVIKKNDIFAQATFVIGTREDSRESIEELRRFSNYIDPDLAIFFTLTPLPGTTLYETALQNGWIENTNWADYDFLHAIMPTKHLSRKELQEELYYCYRGYYGNLKRRVTGIFSPNVLKRRTYRYLASQGLLQALRDLL